MPSFIALLGALILTAFSQDADATERPVAPTTSAWPGDIDQRSGFRLALPRREYLDEYGQKTFDRGATPGANIAGLQGPPGIQLHSPWATHQLSILSKYLRDDAGFSPRVREIAFLSTSREMDNQFEWTAHEPVALKAGVPATVIDVIKFKKSTEGLDEAAAVIIDLGRQIWTSHKVDSATFARAHALFGSRMLIDLVLLMGHHATIAALLTTVDMQLHEGRERLLPEL